MMITVILLAAIVILWVRNIQLTWDLYGTRRNLDEVIGKLYEKGKLASLHCMDRANQHSIPGQITQADTSNDNSTEVNETVSNDQRQLSLVPVSPQAIFASKYAGVAVTTFLGSPKWFQNRYSILVNSVLSMIDDDWVVQIFYIPSKIMSLEAVQYPGIQRQIARHRVVLTPIPEQLKRLNRNQLLLTSWFWRQVLAEKVLVFGGTATLCANADREISSFAERFDYIGTPWNRFNGRGGDGTISIRSRAAMEQVVTKLEQLELQKDETKKKSKKKVQIPPEDATIVQALISQSSAVEPYRIASNTDSSWFGVNANFVEIDSTSSANLSAFELRPFAISGILPRINGNTRQQILDYCPEMKMMFPVLHNPNCFGAEPNPMECLKSVCIEHKLKCEDIERQTISFVSEKKGKRVIIDIRTVPIE